MPSNARLRLRIARVQARQFHRPRRSLDWSVLTDAELDRLEGVAMQAQGYANLPTLLAALDPAAEAWLRAIATKLGAEE